MGKQEEQAMVQAVSAGHTHFKVRGVCCYRADVDDPMFYVKDDPFGQVRLRDMRFAGVCWREIWGRGGKRAQMEREGIKQWDCLMTAICRQSAEGAMEYIKGCPDGHLGVYWDFENLRALPNDSFILREALKPHISFYKAVYENVHRPLDQWDLLTLSRVIDEVDKVVYMSPHYVCEHSTERVEKHLENEWHRLYHDKGCILSGWFVTGIEVGDGTHLNTLIYGLR